MLLPLHILFITIMKENKKEILDRINKLSKKGTKFESLIINRVLQKLDTDSFALENNYVYTADHKRLVYIIGDEPEVVIEEGVEIIGEMAVARKKELKKVTLPNSLKTIERDAFTDCDALENITIPASVDSIDAYAFGDCDALKSVYFERVPKTLNRKAFADCDRLHDISVPSESVKAIRKALHMVDGDTDFIVVGRVDPNKPVEPKKEKQPKAEKEPKAEKTHKAEKEGKADKDTDKDKQGKKNKDAEPNNKKGNGKDDDKDKQKKADKKKDDHENPKGKAEADKPAPNEVAGKDSNAPADWNADTPNKESNDNENKL